MGDDSLGFPARWARVQPTVTAYLAVRVPNAADVDDLVQEVAVVVHRRFADFDPERDFLAWVLGIARRQLLAHRRRQGRRPTVAEERLDELFVETAHQESGLLARYGSALRRCLERLSPRLRRLLSGHYAEQLSQAEVAAREGMSHAAVRTAIHRGRAGLRRCIEGAQDG